MIKILHTGDFHFSNTIDKLAETINTTNFILVQAESDRPDVIVVGGDSVDEYDSRIRWDSDCARATSSFFERAANIAPVLIIRGTLSHDRSTPKMLSHLRARFPIYVSSDVEQVALMSDGTTECTGFVRLADGVPEPAKYCRAIFTLVPSLDKSHLMASADSSIRNGNIQFRNAIHDLFAGFGIVNDQFTVQGIPTVLVTHGMLTGACFSSGQTAVGEDLEFGLTDLHAAKCSATMLGHVHKFQSFPGNVVYSGSPGRLNFGEQEDKGFVVWEFDGAHVADMRFVQTPARRFCFGEVPEYVGALDVYNRAEELASDCRGADVRFRLQIPEEFRAEIDRDRLEQIFLAAGANKVKLEISIIPRQRARADGISRVDSLADKVQKWGDTVSETIPDEVLVLASVIEGCSAEELLVQAQVATDSAPVSEVRIAGVKAACDRYLDGSRQSDLFGEAA